MVMIMSQILSNVFVSAHNLFETYVFEVGESISDIPTELPRLDDLENPGQLPVQGGTWIEAFTLQYSWLTNILQ